MALRIDPQKILNDVLKNSPFSGSNIPDFRQPEGFNDIREFLIEKNPLVKIAMKRKARL